MFNSNKHTRSESGERQRRRLSYANVASTISVFLVVAGGTALAASLPANSVKSKTVKDNALKSVDLRDDAAVASPDVIDDTLTGADISESTLAQVPDSARLQGRTASSFLSTNVYRRESAVGPGQTLETAPRWIPRHATRETSSCRVVRRTSATPPTCWRASRAPGTSGPGASG